MKFPTEPAMFADVDCCGGGEELVCELLRPAET